MKIGKYKIARVTWVDSYTTARWQEPIPNEEASDVIESVGIEVQRTKRSITISTSISKWGNFMDQITIPMCAIHKVSYL